MLVGVSLWLVLVGSGYLHALNLVPCWLVCPCGWCVLVVRACWKWLPACLETRALLVGVSLCVFVGSGYLHTLNLVPCWFVSWLVRAGWKWLPTCLETRACWFVLVGSGYLHTLKLVPAGSCVLVPCWFVLVGSGYLHTLKLVPAGSCVLVPCWFVLVGVVTCMP